MDVGFVVGVVQTGPAWTNIGWLPASAPPEGRGYQDELRAEDIAQVDAYPSFASPVPRFRAWRCQNCKRIELSYSDPILKAAATNGPPEP